MSTGPLLSDDLVLPDLPARDSHPMDSSRILLGLMTLSRQAEMTELDGTAVESVDGVVSKAVLRRLLSALHFRDVATVRHSRQTATLAVGLAQHLGWEGPKLKVLEVAALLHDIGKIGVPDNVLFKPGPLGPDEADLMSLHYSIGIDVLQACRVDNEVLEIIEQSHSQYNVGTDGRRRTGGEVHQGARILSVADAYDSLATEQVYRPSQSHAEIMSILMDAAGAHFDGNIVCALSRWLECEGLPYSNDAASAANGPHPRGPAHIEDALEANSLCHIFSYLYLLESLYDGFYLVDSDLRFVVWNRGAEQMLGHSSQQILGQNWTTRRFNHVDQHGQPFADHECPLQKVIQTGKPASSQMKMQHADGSWVSVETQSVPLLDQNGQLQGVAEIFRNESRNQRKPKQYRDLMLAASLDALTSVANRGELETQLARRVSDYLTHPDPEPFSVLFLDIDFFKSINDNFGHSTGDNVLIAIARLLQDETYSGELVGRYGGEEFLVLCPGTTLEQAIKRAERLRIAISELRIEGLTKFQLTASMGVAVAEPDETVDRLQRRADKALYMAKGQGRNRVCSLTNEQFVTGVVPSDAESEEFTAPADPFQLDSSFLACTAADLVVYKLGGFVNDQKAKLLEVTPQRALLQVGVRRLLPFWGNDDDSRPIHVELSFGEEQSPSAGIRRGASQLVEVRVKIRPLGWIKDSGIFRGRAERVLKELRSYFAAEW